MSSADREKFRQGLIKAVEEGLAAEAAAKFLLGPIHRRREQIHADLESPEFLPRGGNVDLGVVIMPHLELKVLRQIEDDIASAIRLGQESSQKLYDMEMTENRQEPRARLKF